MNTFDDETKIIEWFQGFDDEPMFAPETKKLKQIYNFIHNEKKWKKWQNSSSKGDMPPDFYNEKLNLMLEVMRVDDHAFVDENGKVINPDLMHQGELHKALIGNVPSGVNLHIISRTPLSTNDDHNYGFYRDNFVRVIEKHKKKIPLYRKNHPNKKLIYFVFDESSMYAEASKKYQATN